MDRITMNRTGGPKFGAKLALLASAAVMTATFTASTTAAAPRADKSYAKAEKALNKGKVDQAIEYAEAAVMADPRNATYRATLGKAYLKAGRYTSAAMSYKDALKLGDQNPSTVLSYALTQTAIGGGKNALDTLMKHERMMDPADAGLAMALAGNPDRGVFILTNALRAGQNTAKVRQNLAYTYALAGNWRAARVMAAEDVPADQLDARLSQWASNAKPEDHMVRVSSLLGIAPAGDRGLPSALALANTPAPKPVMAKAEPKAPVAKPAPKTAPVKVAAAPSQPAKVAPKPASKRVAKAVSQPAKVAPKPAPKAVAPAPRPVSPRTPVVASSKSAAKAMEAVAAKPVAKKPVAKVAAAKPAPVPVAKATTKRKVTPRRSSKTVQPTRIAFVSQPVTQNLPAKPVAPQRVAATPKKAPVAKKAPRVAAKAPKGDSHMVQLGSYNSEAEAKAGWTTLQRKFGDLKAHDVVITKAEVKGKTFYRVAAAGFGRQGAVQMCSAVRSAGRGCFAYAKVAPPAGAVGKGTRIAAANRR
ncbi:MAG: SPOR domain-containing protein [Pseudomonadota bacterium]